MFTAPVISDMEKQSRENLSDFSKIAKMKCHEISPFKNLEIKLLWKISNNKVQVDILALYQPKGSQVLAFPFCLFYVLHISSCDNSSWACSWAVSMWKGMKFRRLGHDQQRK